MDPRDRARWERRHNGIEFDPKAMRFRIDLRECDGDVTEAPAKYEVCSTCRGTGSHVNPSIDSHGLSSSDFDEDPDFAEAYFGGRYDVACYRCGGQRVAPVLDRKRCSPEVLGVFDEWAEAVARDLQDDEAERRAGC